jgi:NitT/TauT family transport system substrate-binding protein
MNATRRLTIALLAAVLTLGVATASRAADAPAVINLINLPADNSAEVYYAQDLGYFKDAGLDVRITAMTNSGAIIAALAGGGGDIGNAVVGSVADARGKGIPILYIAPAGLYDAASPTAALVTTKDSPIKKAADLTGKVVAVSGLNDLTYYATRAWIDKHGGNSAAVKFIELPFPAMAAAVAQRRIDAAYVIEPFPRRRERGAALPSHRLDRQRIVAAIACRRRAALRQRHAPHGDLGERASQRIGRDPAQIPQARSHDRRPHEPRAVRADARAAVGSAADQHGCEVHGPDARISRFADLGAGPVNPKLELQAGTHRERVVKRVGRAGGDHVGAVADVGEIDEDRQVRQRVREAEMVGIQMIGRGEP